MGYIALIAESGNRCADFPLTAVAAKLTRLCGIAGEYKTGDGRLDALHFLLIDTTAQHSLDAILEGIVRMSSDAGESGSSLWADSSYIRESGTASRMAEAQARTAGVVAVIGGYEPLQNVLIALSDQRILEQNCLMLVCGGFPARPGQTAILDTASGDLAVFDPYAKRECA